MENVNETPETTVVDVEPKPSIVQRVARKLNTRGGKILLAGSGTVAALAGTYVFGFRRGESATIVALSPEPELDDQDQADDDEASEDSSDS